MKRLGIIGGLGVATATEFYLEIAKEFELMEIGWTPPIVIGSVSAPLDVYNDCIVLNKCRFLPYLIEEAKRIEKCGVDYIVMPCNTLHRYVEQIRESVNVPVISIVDETIKFIQQHGFKTIGFVSTLGTVQNKVYGKNNYLHVDDCQQVELNKIIIRLVNNQIIDKDKEYVEKVIEGLRLKGADCIALACTDLQLLKPKNDIIPIFDTMKILAHSSVKAILEK